MTSKIFLCVSLVIWSITKRPLYLERWRNTDYSYFLRETFNSFPAREAHCKRESEGPEQQWQAGLHIEDVMDKFRDDIVWSVISLRLQSLLAPRCVFTWTLRAVPSLRALPYSLHPYTFPAQSSQGRPQQARTPGQRCGLPGQGLKVAAKPDLLHRAGLGRERPPRPQGCLTTTERSSPRDVPQLPASRPPPPTAAEGTR